MSKASDTQPPEPQSTKLLIEVGWVVAGQLEDADMEATRQAREMVCKILSETFGGFEWRMPLVQRREMVRQHRVGPVTLLEAGAVERETAHWDFAIVITEADLKGHYKPFMLAAPSQAVNVAVLSTSRLDPEATGEDLKGDTRASVMARRITALALHLIGHLNDLKHSHNPEHFMWKPSGFADLDLMRRYSSKHRKMLVRALFREADERLEERGVRQGPSFVLRATWHDLANIINATIEIRPWLFPLLLSRLTTAAVSTMLVLINTAEAWDLGMSQPPWKIVALSIVTLLGASLYLVQRQHLLTARTQHGWTEQRVITTVSVGLAVLMGMSTMYLLLFGGTLLLSEMLFSPELIKGWAASLKGTLTFSHHLCLSGFIASLGIIIGALGASFEAEDYFRHVALVDEET